MSIMLALDTGLDYKDARCVEAHLIGLEHLGVKGALDYAYEHAPRPKKARCYVEFCCDEATEEVVVADRGCVKSEPIPWGWCGPHYRRYKKG